MACGAFLPSLTSIASVFRAGRTFPFTSKTAGAAPRFSALSCTLPLVLAATRRDAAETGLEMVKVVEKLPLVEVDSLGGVIHVGSAFTLEMPTRIGDAIASNREKICGWRREIFGFMSAVGGASLECAKKAFLRKIISERRPDC